MSLRGSGPFLAIDVADKRVLGHSLDVIRLEIIANSFEAFGPPTTSW